MSAVSAEYSLDRSQPHLVQKFWPGEWGLAHLEQAFLCSGTLVPAGRTKNMRNSTGTTPRMGRFRNGHGMPRTNAAPPQSHGFRFRASAVRAVQTATNGTRKTRRISVASSPNMRLCLPQSRTEHSYWHRDRQLGNRTSNPENGSIRNVSFVSVTLNIQEFTLLGNAEALHRAFRQFVRIRIIGIR